MTYLRAAALALVVMAIAIVSCLAIATRVVVADAHAGFTILYLLLFALPVLTWLLKGGRL